MAKYQHAYVIPTQGPLPGGVLYDKFDNFKYFADVVGLVDKTQTEEEKAIPVAASSVSYYMRSKAKFQRSASTANKTVGVQLPKGAIPGHTITLEDASEKRQFQYDGNDSGLYAFLKAAAKVEITMYGPRGTAYTSIPAA